ncbi:hypothetical protein N0B44_17890 [Roseibacterium beibuensis]|uniref:hypothetical protein n=1 Tax=[Roseibacterium] beibuensis TaxID=1193142 RepID=UPI00217DF267|nr:hypothetical protein [Roseibacterium beibuensis]MCS6624790.1 hypothetical protein [Roseibacterium beibuensis]
MALWIVGAACLLVWCGTWAIQVALWLLQLALRLLGGAAVLAFGLVSILALALLDRDELRRIWRRHRAGAAVAATLARERWS